MENIISEIINEMADCLSIEQQKKLRKMLRDYPDITFVC